MKHRVKTIKFRDGKDSNDMIIRKLLTNFLTSQKIVTTQKRGKALKQSLDKVLEKSKEKTEANKNFLLRYFPHQKIMDALFTQVGPAIAKINGGYTKLTRLTQRDSDGAYMVRVEWAHPIVIKWESEPEKEVKKVAATKPKSTKKDEVVEKEA